MEHLEKIIEKIGYTNNGKLMLQNLTVDERKAVPALVAAGKLHYATFMYGRDAVTR